MKQEHTKTRVIFLSVPSSVHWGRPRFVHSRRRHHPGVCAVLLFLFTVAFCVAVYVLTNYNYDSGVLHWTVGERLRPTAIQSGDGLKVTWYSALNTRDRLAMVLTTLRISDKDPVMLEADVSHISHDVTKLDNEPLMMSLGGDVKSELSLEEWLDIVVGTKGAGIKLNFMTVDSLQRALQVLKARGGDLEHVPVWLTVNVVPGPGSHGNLVDVKWVTQLVSNTYPRAQLVFSWSMDCCEDEGVKFGRGSMESMLKACQTTQQSIIVSAPATHAASQWNHFRWLLESSDMLSLLLWSPEGDKSWKNDASYFDLLTVRSDWDKRRIFYNMPEAKLQHFRKMAATAGSLLQHFDMLDRDAARVTWTHGANWEHTVAQAGKKGSMVVEGDVILEGMGTSKHSSLPVMSHPPLVVARKLLHFTGHGNDTQPLTLTQWLDLVLTTNMAIKLDIKTSEAVVPALKVLAEKRPRLQRPIWLNGDVLRGPNGLYDAMNISHFFKSVNSIFPEVTFSLGWTSDFHDGQDNEDYSWEMIETMERIARSLKQPVNFGVRAVFARRSWDLFDWLLRQSRRYTVTLWAPILQSDKVTKSDMDFVRHQTERSRIFFDVPSYAMPTL